MQLVEPIEKIASSSSVVHHDAFLDAVPKNIP
jgi:hypothetical protein